jgi:diaminopimelate decarboxylase
MTVAPPPMTVVSAEARAQAELGGLDPGDLAAEFGTPLYVYDLDAIDRRVGALRDVLPAPFDIAYAVKANPSVGIVAHLAGLGLGADVASGGELATALRAGIDPSLIVFTGPGKRDDELALAAGAGLRAVTVESPWELARLETIAARLGARVPIVLRVATAAGPDAATVPIAARHGGKFGMDPSDLPRAARGAAASRYLRLLGLHAFGASNVLDADDLSDHISETVERATAMARRVRADGVAGFRLELVDVGGGLGIPYADDEREFDLVRLGARLADFGRAWASDADLRKTLFLLEPGRFLVGLAGTYVTRVVDRKVVDGRRVVIVDGGIHHLVRPALIGRPHRIVNLARGAAAKATSAASAATAAEPGTFTIAGPLCSGLDVLADDARLASPEVGDLLGVLDVGAYGFTESMPLFLSHPTPAEVAIRGGRVALLRGRIEPGTWLESQHLPAW